MFAKNTVYLAEDHATPVPEGDKRAKFLLVRAGHEIEDASVAKYEGASELIGGTKKVEHEPEEIQTREPHPKHRDPSTDTNRSFPNNTNARLGRLPRRAFPFSGDQLAQD